MKKRIIMLSLVSMLVLGLFTGCYTSFGTVRHYDVYEDEVVYYDDDDSATVVSVYQHYSPYYPTNFVYYDPYDNWYDEPVFFISIGYDYRPHYYVNYYPYGGCIYPGWYPVVYRPYYVPVWYYGHQNYHRNYYDYKRRDFAKRNNLPGRYYANRDRRDGYYKPTNNKEYVNDDTNYGRRPIDRRNTDISREDTRIISGRDDVITKRNEPTRQPEKSIKTIPVRKSNTGSSDEIINKSYSSKERSKAQVEKKITINKRSTPKVEKRTTVTNEKYNNSSSKSNSNSKQKSYSSSTRESRSYSPKSTETKRSSSSSRPVIREKSEDTKNSSSSSRPSVREKSESSSSSQSKGSSSSRSSYTPSKSSSKSSSDGSSNKRRR